MMYVVLHNVKVIAINTFFRNIACILFVWGLRKKVKDARNYLIKCLKLADNIKI